MVNKLRTLSLLSGGFLVALSAWGLSRYGGPPGGFLGVAALGAIVASLPWTLAYLKLYLYRAYWWVKNWRSESAERGSIFVSETPVSDREAALDDIADALAAEGVGESVAAADFSEGRGLTVTHAGFHNSFVRVGRSDRVVVTGASEKTRDLAENIEEVGPLSFERTYTNPFTKPIPVRGAFRVFLGLAIVALVLYGVGSVADAAYPSDVYNPAEKTVLVSIDARTTLDPGRSRTEAHLDRASFLVQVLEEEAVEIRWDRPSRATMHGDQALLISRDVRDQLEAARASSLTPVQAERAARIEARLHDAEQAVATALEETVAEQAGSADKNEALADASALRAAANRSVS